MNQSQKASLYGAVFLAAQFATSLVANASEQPSVIAFATSSGGTVAVWYDYVKHCIIGNARCSMDSDCGANGPCVPGVTVCSNSPDTQCTTNGDCPVGGTCGSRVKRTLPDLDANQRASLIVRKAPFEIVHLVGCGPFGDVNDPPSYFKMGLTEEEEVIPTQPQKLPLLIDNDSNNPKTTVIEIQTTGAGEEREEFGFAETFAVTNGALAETPTIRIKDGSALPSDPQLALAVLADPVQFAALPNFTGTVRVAAHHQIVPDVPAASTWGLIVVALSTLCVGTVRLGRTPEPTS